MFSYIYYNLTSQKSKEIGAGNYFRPDFRAKKFIWAIAKSLKAQSILLSNANLHLSVYIFGN